MITYQIDILDVESGDVKRVDSLVGWTEFSPKVYREGMCDCNLAGMRNREIRKTIEGMHIEDANHAAFKWRRENGGCDHSMPPKHFRAVMAYLQDGRIYDFKKSTFQKAAA
jgi:hypothetical protein